MLDQNIWPLTLNWKRFSVLKIVSDQKVQPILKSPTVMLRFETNCFNSRALASPTHCLYCKQPNTIWYQLVTPNHNKLTKDIQPSSQLIYRTISIAYTIGYNSTKYSMINMYWLITTKTVMALDSIWKYIEKEQWWMMYKFENQMKTNQ